MQPSAETVPGLVSVIIPTFNRAGLVVQAVESVLRQDYPHKQVIVIDDGSTDDTARRIQAIPGVEYHYQPNRRQPAARNHGLTRARGGFIASLDSDDVWHPNFLSASVAALETTACDLSFASWLAGSSPVSAFDKFDYLKAYMDRPAGEWFQLTPAQTRHLFFRHCPAPSSGAVIRRAAIKSGWNEQTRVSDDWMLWLDAVVHGQIRSVFTMEALWTKRLDGTNIFDSHADSGKLAANEISDVGLILEHYGQLLVREERNVLHARLAQNYFDLAHSEIHGGQKKEAVRHFWSSFRLKPAWRTGMALVKATVK